MGEPIVYIDRSRIRPGKAPELLEAAEQLVAFIDEQEPQLLHYGFHIDEDAARMTVAAVHPDSDSVELHMKIGAEAFAAFAELIEMEGIEVYGEPEARVVERLRLKAATLGARGSVAVAPVTHGFTRLPAASRPGR